MNKQPLAKFAHDVRLSLSRHAPEILMGMGITGMVTTTILAVKATPKALMLIEDKKDELDTDTLTPIETVKATWKCYIPAAITGATSVACLIGSASVSARRHAALATAYKISETAFSEYKEKVVETIGEKKEKAVRDKVAEKQIDDYPVSRTEVFVTGKGQTLFFEPLSSRYFYSDLEKLNRAVNKLNNDINTDPFDDGVTVNDFYNEIGLPPTMTGDSLGWKIGHLIKFHPSAQMAEEGSDYEGQPCIVLSFDNAPRYDFL